MYTVLYLVSFQVTKKKTVFTKHYKIARVAPSLNPPSKSLFLTHFVAKMEAILRGVHLTSHRWDRSYYTICMWPVKSCIIYTDHTDWSQWEHLGEVPHGNKSTDLWYVTAEGLSWLPFAWTMLESFGHLNNLDFSNQRFMFLCLVC